jgi:hypothetical protein
MNIIGRIELPNFKTPMRAYVHGYGYEVYGTTPQKAVEGGREHLLGVLRESIPNIEATESGAYTNNFDFAYAILWAEANLKIVDFFGLNLGDINTLKWPGNPELVVWGFVDGKFDSGIRGTCEDGILVIAKETMFRRSTLNLNSFVSRINGQANILGTLERSLINLVINDKK